MVQNSQKAVPEVTKKDGRHSHPFPLYLDQIFSIFIPAGPPVFTWAHSHHYPVKLLRIALLFPLLDFMDTYN